MHEYHNQNYNVFVDEDGRSINEWAPTPDAESFLHASINFCDEMDTHNVVLDYDATITGTAGITDHALDQLKDHNFTTYWQADSGIADDDQYFETELSDAVYADSYIMNFHKPQALTTPPYTPHPNCWKAWTLKGKLLSGDSWTTLDTITSNTIKFYRGTFTRGQYKYFRVESISAYDDTGQSSRIDAYLYNFGIYDSTNKWNDTFPDTRRGRNDCEEIVESTKFSNSWIYINSIDWLLGDVYSMNGELSKYICDNMCRRYRHIGGVWSEFNINPININYPQALKQSRINSLDFTAEANICLYMFPPPNEIWWFLNSGYAFDETTANMNTPILLKSPDNACKITPSYTTVRTYSSFAVLGARYKDTLSGVFKTGKYYITFSDNMNMESQIKFDGQEGKGLITDMNGTALTGATHSLSNVNVGKLKIGRIWRGYNASVTFNPPIKLDGDVATDLFEYRKNEKVLGSVFRYNLAGYKVPK
jgi:hypothetical protein